MNKKQLIPILIIFLAIVGFLFFTKQSKQVQTDTTAVVPQETKQSTAQEVKPVVKYTLDDVAEHSSPEDCWLIIDSKIYDASNFGTKHPGKEAVYEGCGIDATKLFNTRPMGSGTSHSDKARTGLENFYIGDLNIE